MQAHRNPTRRNKNIGTAKQGHGQDNRFTLPVYDSRNFTPYYQVLGPYKTVFRMIHNRRITFLVERTYFDHVHACTVDDIAFVLECVHPNDLNGLDLVVLRQPKRKEEPTKGWSWGRWVGWFEIDEHSGAAVLLDAMDVSKPYCWLKSLGPNGMRELERLRRDGHGIEETKRRFIISPTLETVRNTQLYRTLPHEIGHHIDNERDPDAFDFKTSADKEAFAHGYADRVQAELRRQGMIPFERRLSLESLQANGLDPGDFLPT